jgi:hypothetical protein
LRLAFASFRLDSKFDIANGTRELEYLDAILPQIFKME